MNSSGQRNWGRNQVSLYQNGSIKESREYCSASLTAESVLTSLPIVSFEAFPVGNVAAVADDANNLDQYRHKFVATLVAPRPNYGHLVLKEA